MEKTYRIKNLDCANCASKMERSIQKIAGVQAVSVNFLTQKVTIAAQEEDLPKILQEMQVAVQKIEAQAKIMA